MGFGLFSFNAVFDNDERIIFISYNHYTQWDRLKEWFRTKLILPISFVRRRINPPKTKALKASPRKDTGGNPRKFPPALSKLYCRRTIFRDPENVKKILRARNAFLFLIVQILTKTIVVMKYLPVDNAFVGCSRAWW